MSAPHPQTVRHRALTLAAAALALCAALLVARQNALRGFPDGHLTSFARCMDPAFALLPFALSLCALAFALAAILPRYRRALCAIATLPVVVALGHLLVASRVTCQGLENGWGG